MAPGPEWLDGAAPTPRAAFCAMGAIAPAATSKTVKRRPKWGPGLPPSARKPLSGTTKSHGRLAFIADQLNGVFIKVDPWA
jgi:hypothetical protein